MKLKQTMLYQLYDARSAVMIFYGVIYSIILLTSVFFVASNGDGSSGGMESASVIFLFIAGLNSFKAPFRFLLANGISRKTQFMGFVLSLLPFAGGMVLIDHINGFIFSRLTVYDSMYFQIYGERYAAQAGGAVYLLESVLWSFCLYICVSALGFFISTLYYRMNKVLKTLVSVGVPVTLVVGVPYMDYSFFGGSVAAAIGKFFLFIMGFDGTGFNPYSFMLSNVIFTVILGALSYLLVRRAPLKD